MDNTLSANEIIQDLIDAIPQQTADADWWESDLVKAVENAKRFLDQPAPQGEGLYRWVNVRKRELLPEIDSSDFPENYFVRFKGDDPRSGWVDAAIMTAKQLRECDYSDYWEWLEPVPSQPQGDVSILTNALDKIYNGHFPNAYDQDARIVEMRVAAKSAVHAYQSSIKPISNE